MLCARAISAFTQPLFGAASPAQGLASICRLALLTGLLLVAGVLPCQASDNPLDSLHLAQRGIDECNADAFNRAVDVSAITGKASDALLSALRKQAASGNMGDSGLALAVGMLGSADEGTTSLIKPLLISEVRGFINTGINGGYFAGKADGSVTPSRGSLASTLEKMPEGRRQIVPGKLLAREGSKATVSGVFIDPKAGSFPLVLEMQHENGLWRVKEISNAQSLFEEAARRDK